MANEYVSQAELKATLEITGETFADQDIDLALTAASRGIDKATRRRFYLDADDTSVRYYTPDERGRLEIDDLVDVASVKTDPGGDGTFEETWTENVDYVLEPLNAAEDGEPWTHIRARRAGGYRFPCGVERSVQVTGQFGWSEVPEGVKQATILIATRLMNRARSAPFGVVAFGIEGAAHIARNDPDAAFLLGPYTRHRIAAA